MIKGSHNTMTYLPVRSWWMGVFGWMARCQSKSIGEQYAEGVRLMDLRVGFKDGVPEFRHGLIRYVGNVYDALNEINRLGDVTVRIVLEERSCEDDGLFAYYVGMWRSSFVRTRWVCGVRKHGWKELCGLPQIEGDMLQWCSSMQGGKLAALWPWLWAKRNEGKEPEGDWKYVLRDFV